MTLAQFVVTVTIALTTIAVALIVGAVLMAESENMKKAAEATARASEDTRRAAEAWRDFEAMKEKINDSRMLADFSTKNVVMWYWEKVRTGHSSTSTGVRERGRTSMA